MARQHTSPEVTVMGPVLWMGLMVCCGMTVKMKTVTLIGEDRQSDTLCIKCEQVKVKYFS
jgi:hypothetical protein